MQWAEQNLKFLQNHKHKVFNCNWFNTIWRSDSAKAFLEHLEVQILQILPLCTNHVAPRIEHWLGISLDAQIRALDQPLVIALTKKKCNSKRIDHYSETFKLIVNSISKFPWKFENGKKNVTKSYFFVSLAWILRVLKAINLKTKNKPWYFSIMKSLIQYIQRKISSNK